MSSTHLLSADDTSPELMPWEEKKHVNAAGGSVKAPPAGPTVRPAQIPRAAPAKVEYAPILGSQKTTVESIPMPIPAELHSAQNAKWQYISAVVFCVIVLAFATPSVLALTCVAGAGCLSTVMLLVLSVLQQGIHTAILDTCGIKSVLHGSVSSIFQGDHDASPSKDPLTINVKPTPAPTTPVPQARPRTYSQTESMRWSEEATPIPAASPPRQRQLPMNIGRTKGVTLAPDSAGLTPVSPDTTHTHDLTTASEESSKSHTKVRFEAVTVREHTLCVAGGGAVSPYGPSLGLGWEVACERTIGIDAFESWRVYGGGCPRATIDQFMELGRVDATERMRRLLDAGHTADELLESAKATARLCRLRQVSIERGWRERWDRRCTRNKHALKLMIPTGTISRAQGRMAKLTHKVRIAQRHRRTRKPMRREIEDDSPYREDDCSDEWSD